jgi:two-component system sensor histidine kinase QseC
MTGLWHSLRRPSLMRRLLLAQMTLLAIVWGLVTLHIVTGVSRDTNVLETTSQFDAILAVADSLAGDPARLRDVMTKVDASVTSHDDVGDLPYFVTKFALEQNGRTVFQSAGFPAGIHPARLDRIETIEAHGIRWRARARRLVAQGTTITVVVPADSFGVLVSLSSHNIYLLPLLVSLPILALPAWLSIHLAMRPWRRVAAEVASRGPLALQPLTFRPPHRELETMIENIDALMQRVSDSTRRERTFIADAAHELRTPLAAMRVNVEALQAQATDPRQQALLGGILSSTRRAGRLVAQMLLMMRNEVTHAAPEQALRFDLLLQDRMAELSGLALAAGVELELLAEPDAWVRGQRDGLVSLVDNLVENAIKYSPRGGTVSVALSAAADHVGLTVRDQGRGIPAPLRTRVFDRFYRDPDQAEPGSGLGLAIVKAVVVRHGGAIVLADAGEGSGLLVQVSLPRDAGSPAAGVPAAGTPAAGAPVAQASAGAVPSPTWRR